MQNHGRTHICERVIALIGLSLVFGIGCCACGIKSPPVPPRQPPLPAVVDVAHDVDDREVRITWSLTEPLSPKRARGAVFGVYRSRTRLVEPACDGCPLVFDRVAAVPYIHADPPAYTTTLPLDPGYRYRFKVRLETDGGATTESTPIHFEFRP